MTAKRGTILLMNTQDTPNTRHPSNHDGQHHTHDDTTTQNTTHATASLFRTSTITLLFQILLVGLGFGISIILARWLGASGRGAYTLMLLTAMLLARFGSLGIEVSNAYYAAHRDAPLPAMIANSLLVCLVVSVVLLGATFGITQLPAVQDYLARNDVPFPLFAAMVSIAFPASLLSFFFFGLLQGREHVLGFNSIQTTLNLVQTIMLLIFVVGLQWGLAGAVWGYVISSLASVSVGGWFLSRITSFSLRPDLALLRRSLSYALVSYGTNVALFLNYRIDQFLVGYFLGAAEVGLYIVAVNLVERLWMIPESIAKILFPRTSSRGTAEANIMTPRVARTVFLMLLLLSGGLAVVAKPVVLLLFGEEFAPATAALWWLLPGGVALGYGKILMNDLAGRGKPQLGLLGAVISLILMLALNPIFIPRWGIAGSAVVSTISYAAAAVVFLIAFVRVSGVPATRLFTLTDEDWQLYRSFIGNMMLKARKLLGRKAGG